MPKERTHAKEHWLAIQADVAMQEAIATCQGHHYHAELLEPIDLQDIADDFRAAVGDSRYYDSARTKALRIAARLLRVAAIAHREAVREL